MLRGKSSVSRKPRAGASALTPLLHRRTRLRYYSDDDDDGSHSQDDGDREEDEQQIRGKSSVGRKRTRSSARHAPLPRRTPQRYYSEDDDDDDNFIDDGRWDDDDREEDKRKSGNGDEHGSSGEDRFSGGSDANDVTGGVAEPAAPEEEDNDDDDRPISVVSRARTLVHRGSSATAPPESSPPAAPAPPPEPSPLSDSSSVIRNMTVENSSVFDCSICYLPLKSPIFQCTVGHVVCSPCLDRLGQATRCHVCRVPTPVGFGYSRCNAMEQVVDSIRVPCPHAAHGCAERLAYQDRDAHAATCAHKPCRCPADGCGFAGSVQTTLLEHFAAVHGWPCSAGNTGLPSFCVRLRKGFNVVTAGATTGDQYTLVLNVCHEPVCIAITAFCIHPRNTGTVSLNLHCYHYSNSDLCTRYIQTSVLNVVCTDLTNGVPSCRSLPLPKWSDTEGEDDHIDMRLTVDHTCGLR